MALLKLSTAYTRMFMMVLASDHFSPATGLTPVVTLSKAGAAFGAAGGAVSEVSSGWYKIALSTTDTNTLGDLAFHCAVATADNTDFVDPVVAIDVADTVRMGLTALPNAVAEGAGGLYTRGSGAGQINQAANGNVDVNVVKIGSTTQTARDIGASVLLSTGTGTGQLDFTAGVVKANLAQILGTAVTETAGQIAAGFKKVFDVAVPVFTAASVNQTGDAYARLGAPAGASVSADIAAAKVDTAAVKAQTDKMTFTVANQMDSNVLDWKSATAPAMTGDAFARLGAPAGASVSADIAAAKVDTAAIKTKTDSLTFSTANQVDATTVTNSDKTGYALSAAGTLAIWDKLTAAIVTANSIGKLLVDNVNATISSRATQTSVDTVATYVDTEVATIAAGVVDMQSRLPAALVGGRMSSDAVAISGSTATADDVEAKIGNLDAAITTRATPAQVNTEVVDALSVDTYGEPTGAPPASNTLAKKLGFFYEILRNRIDVDATSKTFYDDGNAAQWSKTLSDNGVVYSEAEGS